MTTAHIPAAPESSDRESGTNDPHMNREVYPRQQQQGHPEADLALPNNLAESAETVAADKSTYQPEDCSPDASADTMLSDARPSQQSRSSGIFGMFAGAVDRIIPYKARQKEEGSIDKQRRSPTPKSHEPTERFQHQANHKAYKSHEQASRPQAIGKNEPDGPLESRRMLEVNLKKEVVALRDELHRLQIEAKRDARELRERSVHAKNMENIVETLRNDLKEANNKVAALQETVAENEVIITQANATAVSRLASNVSREFTDDMIRETLKKFFQTDFFSWCADLCAEKVEDERAVLQKLLKAGIINASRNYLDGPEYLMFNINTPDGSGPLMLLQAALATRLCDLYLTDPYFLAQELHVPTNHHEGWMLSRLEHNFNHAGLDAATNWRVQTLECLEQAVPITESYGAREAHRFVHEYAFLLSWDQYDLEAGKDLAQIFANFASLAMKLWKSRGGVSWAGMKGFRETYFTAGNPWLEVKPSTASATDQQLHGRPVGLIIRPTVWTNLPTKDGKEKQVIWLKALAWVSGEEDPMDSMDLV